MVNMKDAKSPNSLPNDRRKVKLWEIKSLVEQLDQMITDLGNFNDEILLPVVESSGNRELEVIYNKIDSFVGDMTQMIYDLIEVKYED